MNIQYLSWDSTFFGKKIGKCVLNEKYLPHFNTILNEAINQGFKLLYVYTPESFSLSNQILNKYNGILADRKVIYHLKFKRIPKEHNLTEEYTSSELNTDLEYLAYLSGLFSRFKLDKGFSINDFYRLYKTWITKSINREIADNVFIIKENLKIVAMVTLKHQKPVGTIGLLAVDDLFKGKGYGRQLIEKCKNTLIDYGIKEINVNTQLFNNAGCSFYEKCGFKKRSITNIYHFWL